MNNKIVVDSSVWIDHFSRRKPVLLARLSPANQLTAASPTA
ncbi:hypothetical protein ACNI65_23805 [Roseateles sp. So40a]